MSRRVNSCHVDLRCSRFVSVRAAACQFVSICAVSIRVMPSFRSVPCWDEFLHSAKGGAVETGCVGVVYDMLRLTSYFSCVMWFKVC